MKTQLTVSLLDVVRCAHLANQNHEDVKIIEGLVNTFTSANSLEVSLPVDSKEAECILRYYPDMSLRNYITFESLNLAFVRLYFGKNDKELLKKIEGYFHKYTEALIYGEDVGNIKQSIMEDEEVFNYIKQFSNFTEYEESLKLKRAKRKKLVNNNQKQQDIQGKSIIE